jgi:hypothetical protein
METRDYRGLIYFPDGTVRPQEKIGREASHQSSVRRFVLAQSGPEKAGAWLDADADII